MSVEMMADADELRFNGFEIGNPGKNIVVEHEIHRSGSGGLALLMAGD
jgi:hypothetical protein